MQDDKELLTYFIVQTNLRLEKIDANIERLIAFRFMLVGAAAVVSLLVSLTVSVLKL